MHATTVAIDLAKDVFELAFADAAQRVVERKRLKRAPFSRVLENRESLQEKRDGGISPIVERTLNLPPAYRPHGRPKRER